MNTLRIGDPIYGGSFATSDPTLTLPFVLPGELVRTAPLTVLEPSPDRVVPACPHFGTCGGCHLQMASYVKQLDVKILVLKQLLSPAGVVLPANIQTHASPGPYEYRNRIRLRIQHHEERLRAGYNIRSTTQFLPITTCPIAAPLLFPAAEALLALVPAHPDAAALLNAAHELELFTNHDLSRLQLTIFINPRTRLPQGALDRILTALQQKVPEAAGLAAEAFDPRTGPTGRTLATAGAQGLNYTVGDDTHWISRGAFFQTNRFLLPTLATLATSNRSGALAWDLFAGVGLFARILARSFARITAVEANPIAAADLTTALKKISLEHTAVRATTLDFLTRAALDRDRPDFILLDPPRAGLGPQVCALLLRLAAPQLTYVSCDPQTLARDLAQLTKLYRIDELHLVDFFPQTFHQETVVMLRRR